MIKRLLFLAALLAALTSCTHEPPSPPGPPAQVFYTLEDLTAAYPDTLLPTVTDGIFTDATPYDSYLSIRYELVTGEVFAFRVFHRPASVNIVGDVLFENEQFRLYLLEQSANDVENVTPYLLVTPDGDIVLRLFNGKTSVEDYAKMIVLQ